MPETTSPDNLRYPVGGDNVAPLRTWFANLAADTQAAITSLRSAAVTPEIPDPKSATGAETQGVTATAWADLPGITSVSFTLDRPAWVSIDVGAWIVATAGDIRVSARVSGATTLGETQLQVGGSTMSWGQVMYAYGQPGSSQCTSHRTIRMNAGVNTIAVRAYRTGSGGACQANYATLQVSPLSWA